MKRNYHDPTYADWRKRILKRDGRKCRMPGCKCKTRLQVHHIRKWASAHALRYELSNGITLCYNCHKSITGKEIYYEKLFMEIIHDL
jgi:5-methylcytosine-specific restriction endonuclease McrA